MVDAVIEEPAPLRTRRIAAEAARRARMAPSATTAGRTPLRPVEPTLVDDLTRLPDWWRVRYVGKDELPSDWNR